MEIRNKYSKIVFDDKQLKSTINGKFLNVDYDKIKEIEVFSYKNYIWVTSIIGIGLIIYGQSPTETKLLDTIYTQPASTSKIIFFTVVGILLTAYGYYRYKVSNKSKFNDIKIKFFEGKIKKKTIYISDDKDEINQVKKEIRSKI